MKTLKELREELAAAERELGEAKIAADAAELAVQWAKQRRFEAAQKLSRIRLEISRTKE